MNKYVIIPGCSDLNRGDQALVWETKRFAEDCGFNGEFYLTSERNEPIEQSKGKGLKIIQPILEHPSRKFKNKENISYTKKLKIMWGIVSIFDLIGSLLILWSPTRELAKLFLSKEKRYAVKIMEQSEAVFMKGGGLLQTYGGLYSTYSMYFWVYPMLLAHKLKKPVYVMPNSFGPFKGPFVKNIARAALKKCKVLTSRETLSEDMVKNQLRLDIINCPDLAFTLPKAELVKEKIFREYNLPTDRKLVAITMRPYRFPSATDPELAYKIFKVEMAAFFEWLYDQGYMPVIVEHTLAVNAHENDGACIKDVTAMVSDEKYRFISDTSYDCYDLKTIYSYCDYIVGTRFHSVIFSFGSDTPGIAIAYTGNKSQGIMHDIGLDDFVIEIGDVRAELLKKKFKALTENESEVKNKINNYRIMAESSRAELIEACRK
ncbi:hypothetical protein AXY43_20155 [Clostridium sp. MF28]|uniref:polysaccharide pyruvyl transferase family protein n=1 Tax=Clostridium TaxID=1485 RepID=UPI000CF8F14B|nr:MULTISPECIES: polysaccharide pyruvyl transferase family protein [Clostridium]AVK50115.1 hypothetical protein AXY43_20155 [Clostridium sp. MF28]PSM57649.1 hypothetical protein C4L39_11720 [Clostridium diolis]